MTDILNSWIELGLIFSAAIALCSVLRNVRLRARRRTSELNAVRQTLPTHYEAMDRVISDPATPNSAREFLVTVSEIISDRNIARTVVADICKGATEPRNPSRAPLFVEEIDAVRLTRPDLYNDFYKALSSAMVILFLRWPENSALFQSVMAEMVDQRREAQIASRMADLKRKVFENDRKPDDHIPHNGAIAAF